MAKTYEEVMEEQRDAKEKNRQLGTANELKYQAAKELRNTPQTLEQRQESQKQRKITDERIKGLQREAESAAGIPSDIADQLQSSKNERAAAAYEKRRAAGKDYKKGGSVKSKAKPKCKCMARGGGCEVRGKTKGRFV